MPRIEININRCKGCALCVETCPEGCIKHEGEVNNQGYRVVVFTDAEKCKGCMLCSETCPDVAIEVYK